MPMARDRARDVDEVHDGSAQDVPERIGIIRQDDLHHPVALSAAGASRRSIPAVPRRRTPSACSGAPAGDLVADRVEEGDRRFVGLELRDAARAAREVALELRVDVRRQLVLDVVREEPDEVGAAPFRPGYRAHEVASSAQFSRSRCAKAAVPGASACGSPTS